MNIRGEEAQDIKSTTQVTTAALGSHFDLARVMTDFDALLEEMVHAHFSDGTSVRKRIANLGATKEKMRSLLKRMRS